MTVALIKRKKCNELAGNQSKKFASRSKWLSTVRVGIQRAARHERPPGKISVWRATTRRGTCRARRGWLAARAMNSTGNSKDESTETAAAGNVLRNLS
jgi:hypothetical protein